MTETHETIECGKKMLDDIVGLMDHLSLTKANLTCNRDKIPQNSTGASLPTYKEPPPGCFCPTGVEFCLNG